MAAGKMINPEYLFISQATSRVMFELAERVSRELGKTLVLSGNECPFATGGNLDVRLGPRYDNSSYGARLLAWFKFLVWTASETAQIKGNPVVLMTTNPPLLPCVGALLKRTRGWPFVAQVLDVYPDVLVRHGLFGSEHVVVCAWKAVNRAAYGTADTVITLAPRMADTLREYLQSDVSPVVIPSWVDPSWMRSIDRADNWFVKQYGLMDKFVVLYSGNLGASHDISGLIEAAEALLHDPGMLFLFIGGGARHAELRGLAERLENCMWLPYQSEEALPYAMAAADVGVVALGTSSRGVSMPSKSYFLMAASSALLGLTSGDDDVKALIDEYECGVHADALDGARVRDLLLDLRSHPEKLRKLQGNARKAAEQAFSSEVCAQQYVDLLSRLRPGAKQEMENGKAVEGAVHQSTFLSISD